MVGFEPSGLKLGKWEHAFAGATSGFVTRAVLQPLDVLKIRFQLQVEPLSRNAQSKYSGVLQACHSILREEGISALWKGHVPAQALSIGYGVVQFVAFENFTELSWNFGPRSTWQPLTHFICGSLAGAAATVVVQPFDVIRTRFVAQGNNKLYHSMMGACYHMVTQEGPRALYKGLLPTLLQIAPQAGFQFGFYNLFKSLWGQIKGTPGAGKDVVGHFVCGSFAGICAKVAVYPLDLTKKRFQVQGFEQGRREFGQTNTYRGLVDCMKRITLEEGFMGLYKGLTPSLLKAALATAFHFSVYEYICDTMRNNPRR